MKKLVTAIVAHVDAGKTTLSECMLYNRGEIRKMGRVDKKDAFLDTNQLEKDRGITIFAKQAAFHLDDKEVVLLDTPGHVDFSAEMERTLQVLDYATLVISGADGVQGHTRTLWSLLSQYQIPVFVFVNKMDQDGCEKEQLLQELKQSLSKECIDFTQTQTEEFYEEVATSKEELLEKYLEEGEICLEEIQKAIQERQVFPVFFGSALKNEGVEEFLKGFSTYTQIPKYPKEFGARIFKIARDEMGHRLTYLKVTGGTLKVKSMLGDEKVDQIRLYSGVKYEVAREVEAGSICALTGPQQTYPGQGFGIEKQGIRPLLAPVLNYQIQLPEGCDASRMLPKLKQLEEEDPQLHISWDESLQEIHAQLMGEVQTEILKSMIKERFDVDVEFGAGNIVYKETIRNAVEGVGHFEPLRHYAEVHLLLEPLPGGSGIVLESRCSEDLLDKNWQRLILTHLAEREHVGVLTGSAITDIKIVLVSGRAHQKHTEGGDFRQATYRAVRHGLMQAESVLLEPYYEFRLEVPQQMVGRAMTDLEKMHGSFGAPKIEGGNSVLTGSAPVSAMQNYQKELHTYTKGHGKLYLNLKGYDICQDQEEVVQERGYEPERDLVNPADSVFCAHGAGFVVPWQEVTDHMHLEAVQKTAKEKETGNKTVAVRTYEPEEWIDSEEVDRILHQATNANKRMSEQEKRKVWKKKREDYFDPAVVKAAHAPKVAAPREEYLLVDGYNIIFAWEELHELADINIDSARGKLLDILSNYQGIRNCQLIVVFDAYRVQGNDTRTYRYHNIQVVFTKEAETADQYIEKFAHANGKKYRVIVATSDGLEQIIIRGQGCELLSARDLKEEIARAGQRLQENYEAQRKEKRISMLEGIEEELSEQIRKREIGE